MAEEIELLEVQDIPVEEGAGRDADNAEDVVIDLSLLSSMEEKLVSTYRTKPSPFTICRVPANIRECDHAAYNPRIVSIGPFHRGRENLQAMEEHKWRCLHEVLVFGNGRNNLEKFLKKMTEIEMQARNCYSENIQMSSNEFVKMMLLDGGFIIFLILHRLCLVKFDVLIYRNEWMGRVIKFDVLLLENQLPFFVLECLWELIGRPRDTLRYEALKSFGYFFSYELELQSPNDVIHHLLHLLHLSFQPDSPTWKSQIMRHEEVHGFVYHILHVPHSSSQSDSLTSKSQTTSDEEDPGSPFSTSASGKLSSLRLCQHIGKILRDLCPTSLINTCDRFRTPSKQSLPESQHKSSHPWKIIPSATELEEAGVRFQLKQARSIFQVRFDRGLMEMPRLCIFDETNIFFRNFIALEQCFPEWGNHFTTYCNFIDFLVDTPRDVSILREADIIRNGLGSNEEVALLFNKLGKEIVWNVDGSYLADLFDKVNQHTQKRWPKWRAKLVRDYFSNPWAIISLIAAVIILILTFLQTHFSIFAYFNPQKP